MEIVNCGIRNPYHVKILNFCLFILSMFKFWRARTRTWIVSMLSHDLKFMCTEFGQFMMNGYEDMNDNVKTQNGA